MITDSLSVSNFELIDLGELIDGANDGGRLGNRAKFAGGRREGTKSGEVFGLLSASVPEEYAESTPPLDIPDSSATGGWF